MMKWRWVALIAVCVTAFSSCRSETVTLEYRFEEGAQLRYRMTADARAHWDIGPGGEGSYRVTFDVTETIREVEGEGAVVAVVMTPVDVAQSGLPAPGAEELSFALRVRPDGEVVEVLEVDGVSATDLGPDERALIGTYRPPLPPFPVELLDEWEAEQEFQLPSVFQQIRTSGRLTALRRESGSDVAELTFEGEGPLVWTTQLPQGAAELTGSTTVDVSAEFDIDAGLLREASSVTTGDFEVRVVPAGDERVPLSGRLHLELSVEIEGV